jgi:hypothetical protein
MNLEAIADSWDDPQVSESEFRRYWLNQPVPMTEKPISILPGWSSCATDLRSLPGRPSLALALSYDRQFACVGAAGQEGGVTAVKVLLHGITGDVLAAVKALQDKTGSAVVIDEKGPAGSLIPTLRTQRVRVEAVGVDFVCDAAALLLDAVETQTLQHFSEPELDGAVDVAAWRTVGDRRAFGRRVSGGDISPLESVALAALAATRPKPSRVPVASFV